MRTQDSVRRARVGLGPDRRCQPPARQLRTLALEQSALTYQAFDLDGGTSYGSEFVLENLGSNRCGRPLAGSDCLAVTSGLTAPEPVDTAESQ